MSLLSIAWKSVRQRMLASSLTGLSVALGVSLMIAVLIINGIVSRMFSQTGTGYDLVLGPKGSDLQLVLSTVYRIERANQTLPWPLYETVRDDPRIEMAVPVNVGDNTQEGSFPIVGTTPQYFSFDVVAGQPFSVRGEFLQGTWDAVIGSEVARVNGWDIGSEFQLVHSGNVEDIHDEKFTVRGVLARTGTPNDRTAFVNLDGFFQLSHHDKPVDEAIRRVAEALDKTPDEIRQMYAEDIEHIAEEEAEHHEEEAGHDDDEKADHGEEAEHHAEEDNHHEGDADEHEGEHHHEHIVTDLQKEVSAIMVRMAVNPNSPLPPQLQRDAAAVTYQSEANKGFKMQAVRPLVPMKQLMDNLVGNVRLALLYLTGLIVAVSGVSIFVSIYNSMADRRREIAIMRALGARRQTVFSVILAESVLLCLGGGIIGVLLGHGVVFVAAPIVEARSGLLIDPLSFEMAELYIIPAMLVIAALVGFLPGLTAYRTDVADALNG